jgi:hypothetical protein
VGDVEYLDWSDEIGQLDVCPRLTWLVVLSISQLVRGGDRRPVGSVIPARANQPHRKQKCPQNLSPHALDLTAIVQI